jgi:predicted metal-dependent phosphoesterase TrpH
MRESPGIATDLHGHTFFSDATASPEEYVAARAACGLQLIAISDHDLGAGIRRGARAAAAAGLRLLPAMETTAFVGFGTSDAEQFHILAYFPACYLEEGRLEQTFLYQRGLRVQERFRAFMLDWLFSLHEDDRLAIDPFGALAAEPAATFPGLQLLVQRVNSRRPQVFRHFIRCHVRFWTEDRELFGWSPEELIDAIRADGAVDIVAHAARYRDQDRLARVLLGASGVEVYTSRHRPEWAARFRAFAETHDKLWTASTDDHQRAAYTPPPAFTPAWVVERLLDEPLPREWLTGEPAASAAATTVIAPAS